MGRVTRMIKAAADPQPKNAANGSDKPAVDRDLSRVVAAWPHLPDHMKRTVMNLVEMIERKRGR